MNNSIPINTAKLRHYLESEIGLDVARVDLDKIVSTLSANQEQLADFDEIAAAAAAMIAVHETHFLRHSDHFQWLCQHWLPQQVANGAIQLNILSAGCSTGEEPYSLAAQLTQAARPYHLHLTIDACDINKHSLHIAKQGKYGLWSLRGVNINQEQEWLDATARAVYVKEPYKSQVNFFWHNLTQPLPTSNYYDLILCRNVLIYMHPQAVQTIYRHLRTALKPTGILIPGPSDPNPSCEQTFFLKWQHDIRTYYAQAVASPDPKATVAMSSLPPTASSKQAPTKQAGNNIPTQDSATLAAPAPEQQSKLKEHQLINKLIKNGYYDAARFALEKNIAVDPFDVRSYTMLATLALDMDDLNSAAEAARKAAFLDSDSCYPVYLNAEIKFRRGDEHGALRELRWVRQLLSQLAPKSELKYCEEIQAEQLMDVIDSRLNCGATL